MFPHQQPVQVVDSVEVGKIHPCATLITHYVYRHVFI